MGAVTEPGRIAFLDTVRGVAVMGILAMNIVAFAMPFQAYNNPTAYGLEGTADLVSWVVSFVFVDGKMRGLFSFLFGASTLLVIERAKQSGASPARIHYARMLWLLVFGLIHFYFIWFGDILAGYALTGLVLYFFRNLGVRALVIWGSALVTVQFLLFSGLAIGAVFLSDAAAAPNADPAIVAEWRGLQQQFAPLQGAALTGKIGLFQGPYSGLVHQRLIEHGTNPFTGALMFGWETLAYMLFGMAALKSGLFRGEWTPARYRKLALFGFAVTVPVYALFAYLLIQDGFSIPMVFAISLAATTPFRPVMVVAYAALIILVTRSGGALVGRIAAA